MVFFSQVYSDPNFIISILLLPFQNIWALSHFQRIVSNSKIKNVFCIFVDFYSLNYTHLSQENCFYQQLQHISSMNWSP